jgi:hypothetical protein
MAGKTLDQHQIAGQICKGAMKPADFGLKSRRSFIAAGGDEKWAASGSAVMGLDFHQ